MTHLNLDNIAEKPIEMVTMGGRGNRYVDMWQLIGSDGNTLFKYDDKGNLVQTMPKEPYMRDGNEYGPPRFYSYRNFISQLINEVDAAISTLYEEHLTLAPGGSKFDEVKTEFNEAVSGVSKTEHSASEPIYIIL